MSLTKQAYVSVIWSTWAIISVKHITTIIKIVWGLYLALIRVKRKSEKLDVQTSFIIIQCIVLLSWQDS